MIDPQTLRDALPHRLVEAALPGHGDVIRGKVRDAWMLPGGRRALVTTDRVSAFDRVMGAVPFKGQVLNQLAAWWFEQTADIVGNHVVAVPDPNVLIARDAAPLPVEIIVRGYITGVTSTSLWTLYERGVDRPYGLDLPRGLHKDDKLPEPVITPTTKASEGEHDERLTSEEVVARGLVGPALWAKVCDTALALFRRGTERAAERGVLLVDTKYEMGLIDGELCVIDELHTPDSSRYWLADSWARSRKTGAPPEHFDKEWLRMWLKSVGYSGDGPLQGGLPDAIAVELAAHYVAIYERLTGADFVPGALPPQPRLQEAVANWLSAKQGRLEEAAGAPRR